MRRRAMAGLMVACIALDRVTKVIAHETLAGRPTRSYLHDSFRLTYAENSGAILSSGARLPAGARFIVFTVLVGVALAAALVWLFRQRELPRRTALPVTLIIAGGFGNWIDRVIHHGLVADFLNAGIGGLRTGIFNIADMAITFSAIALLLGGIASRPAAGVAESDAVPRV